MGHTILIIDDEETLAHFLAQSLRQEGYQVRLAHSGGQGLAALAQDRVDLVLLDLKLPDMSGLEVLGAIRRADGQLRVIMMSSQVGVESAVHAMRLGAVDYLPKPLDLPKLKRSIQRALEAASPAESGDRATTIREEARAQVEALVPIPSVSRTAGSFREGGEARLEPFTFALLQTEGVNEAARLGVVACIDPGGAHRVALYIGLHPSESYLLAELHNIPAQAIPQAAWRLPAQSLSGLSSDAATAGERRKAPPQLDPLLARFSDEPAALIPFTSAAQVVGWALVLNPPGRPFNARQMKLLSAIGARLGVAVERALREEELRQPMAMPSRLQAVTDSTQGTLVADLEGMVRFANRAAARLLGPDLIGRKLVEVLGHIPGLERESLARGLIVSRWETRVGDLSLTLNISPLRGEAGAVSGVAIEVSDVRQARAMEEERRRLDRLALLGEMSAVVAHEIRNPLAGIGAGLQHMLSKLRSGEELYEDAQRILQESERVDRILEDILSAARPLRLDRSPCDLVEMLDEALQQRKELLEAQRIALTRRFARARLTLQGDARRLRDAFDRLILNAVEAMPQGGSLEVSLQDSGEEALIAIQDSGPGLSPSEVGARLFEPFYSTKAGRAGLGLAIARRIVEAHGGTIEAQSALGQGSTFRVRLPRVE